LVADGRSWTAVADACRVNCGVCGAIRYLYINKHRFIRSVDPGFAKCVQIIESAKSTFTTEVWGGAPSEVLIHTSP